MSKIAKSKRKSKITKIIECSSSGNCPSLTIDYEKGKAYVVDDYGGSVIFDSLLQLWGLVSKTTVELCKHSNGSTLGDG